jgi:RNA polymerase sigma-70 factor (ECF subfamily)
MPSSQAAAFGHDIEPHLTSLFRAAYRLTGNVADAEDLVQDTCLHAFSKRASLRAATSPCNWLIRVQYNLFIDRARLAETRRVERLEPELAATLTGDGRLNPEVRHEERERELRLLDAWSKLMPEQRALLALKAEGHSLADMQAITGLSISVLTARLHRARQRLGRELGRNVDTTDTDLPMECQR